MEKVNAERREVYKKWVEQYTPQQIEQANNARRWLKRHEIKRVDTKSIDDHRRVVAPRRPFIYFYMEDMKNNQVTGPIADAAKEAGRKWKAMSAQDKAVSFVRSSAVGRLLTYMCDRSTSSLLRRMLSAIRRSALRLDFKWNMV